MRQRNLSCLLVATTLLLSTSLAESREWRWNGVITQGLFHTDHYNVYGNSADDISFDFSELFLNANKNILQNMNLAGQLLYRVDDTSSGELNVDYMLLDAQMINSERLMGGVRFGRIKGIYGIYNDTRDVAFTRPSTFLSQGVYQDLVLRDIFVSTEGGSVYLDYFSDVGQFGLELAYGATDSDAFEDNDIFIDDSNIFESVSYEPGEVAQLRAHYTTVDNNLFISFSSLYMDNFKANTTTDINHEIPSFLGISLPPIPADTTIMLHTTLFSIQYLLDRWIFTYEYGNIRYKTLDTVYDLSVIPDFLLALSPIGVDDLDALEVDIDIDNTSQFYYFQLQKRINSRVELFTRYDAFYFNDRDPGGHILDSQRRAGHSEFAKSTSFGIQWRPKRNILANFEYHYVDGTVWLSKEENLPEGYVSRYWNMLVVSASYRL